MIAEQSLGILIDAAREAHRAGRWDDALSGYAGALEYARETDGPSADLLRWMGQVHCRRGEFKEGEGFYHESLAVARAQGDMGNVAEALNSQAGCLRALGRLTEAELLFNEAQRLAEELGNRRLAVMICQNLGALANIRGDLKAALDNYTSAMKGFEDLDDDEGMVWTLNNLAMAYVDLERYTEADGCFTRALGMAEHRRDADMVGTVQVNRAELYVKLQAFDAARACCDQAFEIFGRLESAWGLGETYKAYGVIYRESGKLQLAEAHLDTVLEMARNSSNALLEAEAEHERALLSLTNGNNREALKSLNRAHRFFTQLSAKRELLDIDRRLDGLEESYLQVVATWGESIESKDSYTAGHCKRVAEYATKLAEAVGFGGRDLTWIRMGGFLHDVGKTAVPVEVLNKPGKLDAQEWELMRSHTMVGDDIVAELDFPFEIRPMVRSHHERWDGKGYPDRLAGPDIPLTARILCVADIYDALTTTRSYRPAYSREDALAIMEGDVGAVDPELFRIFKTLPGAAPA